MNEYTSLPHWGPPCGGGGGTGRVHHPADGPRFQTSTSDRVCTSKLWTQHSGTKVKRNRCRAGQGMKTATHVHTHLFTHCQNAALPSPADIHALLFYPRPQEVSMRKPIILPCFALFCIKISKMQSLSKLYSPNSRLLYFFLTN